MSDTDPDSSSEASSFSQDEENDLENRSNQSAKAFDNGIDASTTPLNEETFTQFKNLVFASRPNIKRQYELHHSTPFYEFAKRHIRENRSKTIKQRKHELISVLEEYVQSILGSALSQSLVKQLKTNDSVSTVQHSSPLGHPDSLNAVFENALPYFGANNSAFKNIIVLACSGVSFNNTKFPRGHLFHTQSDNTIHTNQLTFFGNTVSARPVIFHNPYTYDNIIEAKNSLLQLKRDGKITDDILNKNNDILENIYASPHALSQSNYHDQLTVTNYWLFRQMFESYRKPSPSLIYLSQEYVVLELLKKFHITHDTTIHRLLFTSSLYPKIDELYEGVTGAFSHEKKLGSYFFWALPKNSKYRVQLFRNGNRLESLDKTYVLELTPEAVIDAIEKQELIPTVMLTFWVLALYYGLILGGGYEQTFYLTQIKNKYLELMGEIKDTESKEAAENLITTNLVIPRPLLAYIQASNDRRIPATGLDLLLYTDVGQAWQRIIEATKRIDLGSLIERTLPSIYREYTSSTEDAKIFSQITERDIEKFNGLDKKIPALITF